jgi:epoxide hydrolase-like predicted phosphatase
MIKAILFDFGRVITSQKPKSLFDCYEVELNLLPGTINDLMFESPFWEKALVGEIDMDTYWQAIGPQLNLHSPEAVSAFQKRYYLDEKINPDTFELLELLIKQYQLAVVSNHPPGLGQWLKQWDIHWLFEQVICSGDQGVAKPDPALFYMALNRLGVTASEAVFIDDTVEHVIAAQGLGMRSLLFTTAEKLRHELVDLGVIREKA